jgi:hypothetical protein
MIILSVKVNAQGEASLGNSLWPSPRIPNTLTPKLIYIYNSQNKQKKLQCLKSYHPNLCYNIYYA